jgi:hypothetical protein
MPPQPDFDAVFDRLKALLEPYAAGLDEAASGQFYTLDTRHVLPNQQRLNFATIRKGKAYVSLYLFPVYMYPEMLTGLSPELKKRQQGKSSFNFKTVNEALFKELDQLLRAGLARDQAGGYLGEQMRTA